MDFILIHKFLKELYEPELKQMQHKRKHRFGPSHFQTRSAGWDSAAIQATLWKWKTYSQGRTKSPEDKVKSPGEILRSQIVILSSHQGTGENGRPRIPELLWIKEDCCVPPVPSSPPFKGEYLSYPCTDILSWWRGRQLVSLVHTKSSDKRNCP